MVEQAILGLGSNVGDRELYLRKAADLLANQATIRIVAESPIYLTQPLDVPFSQEDYLNQVIVISTSLRAHSLFDLCQEVEESLGRPRDHAPAFPRTIDIDIIAFGDLIESGEDLILPHPRYTQRKFVLVPLAMVQPTFHDPVTGRSIQQLVEKCPDTSSIQRWDQVRSIAC
jgi:2-amino-4-hydroxy-6-hydroxymethyldihydropteridine diphosphokinase